MLDIQYVVSSMDPFKGRYVQVIEVFEHEIQSITGKYFFGAFDNVEWAPGVFWTNFNLARSTFLKIETSNNDVKVDFYRDDARGGTYSLLHSYSLN